MGYCVLDLKVVAVDLKGFYKYTVYYGFVRSKPQQQHCTVYCAAAHFLMAIN